MSIPKLSLVCPLSVVILYEFHTSHFAVVAKAFLGLRAVLRVHNSLSGHVAELL